MAKNAIAVISAQAKKLQRANKKLAWKSAIKKASAMYRAGKVGAAKKAAPKKAAKKSAPKKAARKAMPAARHKDTNSHNVSIRVMSGPRKIGFNALAQIADAKRVIDAATTEIDWHRKFKRTAKYKTYDSQDRAAVERTIDFYKKLIAQKKREVSELKKLV